MNPICHLEALLAARKPVSSRQVTMGELRTNINPMGQIDLQRAIWSRGRGLDTRYPGRQGLGKYPPSLETTFTGDEYVNGTDLARKLGIARSTLTRWIKAGKLPKPKKSISGMLLFRRGEVV